MFGILDSIKKQQLVHIYYVRFQNTICLYNFKAPTYTVSWPQHMHRLYAWPFYFFALSWCSLMFSPVIHSQQVPGRTAAGAAALSLYHWEIWRESTCLISSPHIHFSVGFYCQCKLLNPVKLNCFKTGKLQTDSMELKHELKTNCNWWTKNRLT